MTHPLQLTKNDLEHLAQLREQMASFRVVPCRLMHEEVIQLLDNELPASGDFAELTVRRRGFCVPALRRQLLGCAHTSANDAFSRLADTAYATGALGDMEKPSSVLSEIILRIYQMDHEKGRLEKRFALANHQNDSRMLLSIQHDIAAVIARHDAAIAELECYRNYLLTQLNTALNISHPH